MDLKTFLQNLHEEVSCSVCMSKFTDPKILPCFHTFCLHCLNELQRTSGLRGELTCPECRRKVQVPGSGYPKELPTNFRMNSLLDVMAIQECNIRGVKCGNCEKSSAQSVYCFQCCAFWCEDCIPAHNIIRVNKDHRVLAIKDFEDQDIEDVLKRPVFCQKQHHESEELKFFCKDCDVAICSTCAITLHEGHGKVTLQDAANERKLRLESVLESKREKARVKENMKAKLENEAIKIEEQVTGLKRNVQSFIDNIIKVIESKKREIFKQVEEKAHESTERLSKQYREVQSELDEIETSIAKTETFLKRSTQAEIVQFNKVCLEAVVGETEQSDRDVKGLGQLVFVGNSMLMDKTSSEGIGSLKNVISNTESIKSSAVGKGISEATVGLEAKFTLITRNAQNEQCYGKFDSVFVKITDEDDNDCATGIRVQDKKDGSYNISYFAKEYGICQASVMVNGEHVSGSPFTVEVESRDYNPVLSFGQYGSSAGKFDSPWGVAVNERNEIAVTDSDNHRVQIFSSDGDYLGSFGREGDQEGEFDNPTGIAYLNNGNIVVADNGNNRLQIFTERGEFLSQISGEEDDQHQLHSPQGISVDSDGNIIVTEEHCEPIKIFSPSGHFLEKFGKSDEFEGYPCHCIQKDKYLQIASDSFQGINVFNRDGDFLYKFGSKGEEDGEFDEPQCLSVDKAGNLIVCDSDNSRVQVFKLSGEFIAKFEACNFLEFRPVSSAVLNDGRIVVCDEQNDCIHIFE